MPAHTNTPSQQTHTNPFAAQNSPNHRSKQQNSPNHCPKQRSRGRLFFFFSAILGVSTLHCLAAQPRVCEIDAKATHPQGSNIPFSPSCTPENVDPENVFCLEPSRCERAEQRKGPYSCLVKRCVQVLLDETGKPYPFRDLHACYPTNPPKEPLKGNCRLGQRRSILNGAGLSPCTGAITPVALDTVRAIKDELKRCARTDEDCDGLPDPPAKECPCGPVGTVRYCYPGSRNDATPSTTPLDEKNPYTFCMQGIQACEPDSESNTAQKGFWGACKGFRLPTNNPCSGLDGDCDGQIDDVAIERNCVRQKAGAFSKEPITDTTPANDKGDSRCTVEGGLDSSSHPCADCVENQIRECALRVIPKKPNQGCSKIYQRCEKRDAILVWSSCKYNEKGENFAKDQWDIQRAESIAGCNRKDDDCDGFIDNFPGTQADHSLRIGCSDKDSEKRVEVDGSSFGLRRFCGEIACKGTGLETCEAFTEICNGKDDDCDGLIDNVVPNGKVDAFCLLDTPSGKVLGSYTCENGQPSATCKAVEICNNQKDDNNNGTTDEQPCLFLK